MELRVIQDPVYGVEIPLTETATRIINTEPFQRMRRLKQLGYAYLVYPGAEHTRFQHMLGAYFLATRAIDAMRRRYEIRPEDEEDANIAILSALSHDLGHHPSAHVLELHGLTWADHEAAGERWLCEGPIAEVLGSLDIPDASQRIAEVISHRGDNPFRTLVAGTVDVDGLDYMRRDAFHCFGPHLCGFNQDRLLNSLTLQVDPFSGKRTVMVHERGLHELEQRDMHRYRLYRTVYWHRKVRAASAMARAMILHAVDGGFLSVQELMTWHDEQLFLVLQERVSCVVGPAERQVRRLAARLVCRDLYSSAVEVPIGTFAPLSPSAHRAVEAALSEELGLDEGEALLDIPHNPGMFARDTRVLRKDGSVVWRSELGPEDGFVLNGLGDAMHTAAGCIAVYTAKPRTLTPDRLLQIIEEVGCLASVGD